MQLTYREQYRHPQWQRRRLERLQAADFTCQECAATDKTLNVHHKRYIKGRMVWEYEDQDLEVLCEECHEAIHNVRKRLTEVVARLQAFDIEILIGYAQGLHVAATAYAPEPAVYKLETYEQAAGIADSAGLARDDIDDFLGKDVEITGRFLLELRDAKLPRKDGS